MKDKLIENEKNILFYNGKEGNTKVEVFHYEVLEGNISHKQAVKKVESEYEKYKVIQDKSYVPDVDKLLVEDKEIEKKEK